MKYLTHFKIFESNKLVLVNAYKIDQEIIENCEDILRDFNEENDCRVSLHMRYITDISFLNRALPIPIARNYWYTKEVSYKLVDKKDIIEFLPTTIEMSIKADNFKLDCMRHIMSYMHSLGYSVSFIGDYYYFYRD